MAHAARVDLRVEAVDFDLSADLAYDVTAVIARAREWLEDSVGLPMRRDVPVTIRVVRDRATYDRLAGEAGMRPGTSGFYTARTGGVVHLSSQDEARRTLVHEATHLLLRVAGTRLPRWAHEGLAETFEGFRVSGNAVWLEPDEAKLRRFRREVDVHGLTARVILTATADTWARMGLSGSWPDHTYGGLLTAFLLASEDGRRTLAAIARLPGGRHEGEGVLDAVASTYPGGLVRLEADFRGWWSGSPKALQLPVRSADLDVHDAAPACPNGILMRRGTSTVCSTTGR